MAKRWPSGSTAARFSRGVEAAHEAGIIHRDLKPGNVKLTPDGKVKVLDFGLAKETGEGSSSSSDLTRSPTITSAQSPTAAGVILGTAPYMSPEQARGRPVDRRTDIWAFGVMLYECLAGASPFVGETVSDSIAAILHAEVDFNRLPAGTPRSVRRVLRRCLERDRDKRFRDIGDVGLELVEASEGRDDEPARIAAVDGRRRTSLAWAVAALLALAATVTWVLLLPRTAPMRLVTDIIPQDPEAVVSARAGPPAISPDGARLAIVVEHASERSLIVRDLSTGDENTVASGDEIRAPFWSPDSRTLAYFDGERMFILAPGGARPEPVPGVTVPTSRLATGAWAPDGTIVYGRVPDGLMRVRPFDREPEVLLNPFPDRRGDRVVFPSFLPDGRSFLFLLFESEGEGTTGVYMGSLDSEEFRLVLPVASNAVYASSGMLVFSRAGALLAQRFDIAAGRVEGEPIRIASDVRPVSWPPHALFTVRTPVGVEGSLWSPRLSPDGRFLAFDRTVPETAGDIWVRDLERGLDTRLTSDPKNESNPIWTPDGRSVLFFRGNDVYRVTPDGVSEAEPLHESPERSYPWDVTPDGRTLLFSKGNEDNAVFLWTLDLETLQAQPWLDRPVTSDLVSMSANGGWVAYTEFVQDRLEVFIRSFPDGETVRRVSIDGGSAPRWSDGGELFFAEGSRLMVSSVRKRADGTVEVGRPEQIGLLPPTLPGSYPFDVTPDGTRFLTVRPKHAASGSSLRLVENWGAGGS
jgi:Tol biopolymer transport system component